MRPGCSARSRNQALNSDIQAAQDSLRQAVEKQASLEQEVARERARAQTFVDQAGVLSRELRPDDPDWALRLRIRTVRGSFTRSARRGRETPCSVR